MTRISFTDDKNIHLILKAHADKRPDTPFLHWTPFSGDHKTYSYKEFYDAALRVAAGLRAKNIGAGDYVLLHANNCPEFLLTWHACAALGAIVVTTNPRSSRDELAYFIGHANPKCVITQPEFLGLFKDIKGHYEWLACTETNSGEPADAPLPDNIVPFKTLFSSASKFEPANSGSLTPLSVQYTSGTTSRPKGVVWTHGNAVWAGCVGASHKIIRSDDVAMVITPLCHTNAMSWAHLPVLWSGGSMALQPKFSASRFWDVVQRYKCTWGNIIPFAVHALMTKPVPKDHTMRFWIVGAANVGPIEQHFSVDFIGAWGMTETVIHATYTPPQLPAAPISMGLPMPQYDFKVTSKDGAPTKLGETGDLYIRGERGISMFIEYLHNPEVTNASFDADGWFDTGDRVILAEGGHLRFADRSKDMLKVGAENVAASEIESVINTVEDVMESAVVAKPDKMKDEVPVAYVRTQRPCEELREAIMETCCDKLSDFKRPVAIVFCEDFPRAEMNKIAKGKLREQAATLTINQG